MAPGTILRLRERWRYVDWFVGHSWWRRQVDIEGLRRRRAHAGGLPDVLEVFARLEADCPPGWDPNFLTGPWVTADAPLARLHLEDAEPAELDPVSPLHRQAHRIEDGIDRHLSLHLGDVGGLRDLVDDIDLDHAVGILCRKTVTTIKII